MFCSGIQWIQRLPWLRMRRAQLLTASVLQKMPLQGERAARSSPACLCLHLIRRRHGPGRPPGVVPHGVSRPRQADAGECARQTGQPPAQGHNSRSSSEGSEATGVGEAGERGLQMEDDVDFFFSERRTGWPFPPWFFLKNQTFGHLNVETFVVVMIHFCCFSFLILFNRRNYFITRFHHFLYLYLLPLYSILNSALVVSGVK